MSNVLRFLQSLATRPDRLDALKTQAKADVIAAASESGVPFDEGEFDAEIWDLEVRLAARRGEPFDQHFPLWQTMWGQFYLEYLVNDLIPALRETSIIPAGQE